MVETTSTTGTAKPSADSKAGGQGELERNCPCCPAHQRCFQPLSQRPSVRGVQRVSFSQDLQVQKLLHLTPESWLQNSL